jgi:hypothetical protein
MEQLCDDLPIMRVAFVFVAVVAAVSIGCVVLALADLACDIDP